MQIERVEIIKYLGIIIDDRLRFKDRSEYMLKIGKTINLLNRMGKFISTYTRCVVYESIMAPDFEYCAILIINMRQLSMLQKAQNGAMRVILHCDKYTKIDHTLETLQLSINRDYIIVYAFLSIRY